MEKIEGWKFIRLVHALRQVALPIYPAELFEAQMCLANYPDIPAKQILSALFVRRSQDALIFETVWETLFDQPDSYERTTAIDNLTKNFVHTRESVGIGGLGQGRGWGGVSLTEKGSINSLSALKPVTPSRLAELVRSGGDYEEVLKQVLAEINYFGWINAYDLAYQRGELSEDEWFLHQDERTVLVKEVRRQLLATLVNQENSWLPIQRGHWLYKPLSTLTEDEKRQVKESIRKWARTLAVRPGGRWKRKHKGSIDMARLVQQSVQGDGKIFYLSYRQQVPRISELVVLCDVSNSVASYVEFLLFMVGCLRVRFRKMRVFLFIDTIWDVEGFEWKDDLEGLMQEIKSWAHKESSGFSDYGKVFRDFAEEKLDNLSARATLLIWGDGKNNYRPPQTEYLAQISDKVRKVYWLNPLNLEEWKEPDNAMKHYQEYCTRAYRCRSARDLQQIVRTIG